LFRYPFNCRARIIASPKALQHIRFCSIFDEQDISPTLKGMIMASTKNSRPGNQGGTHEQHVKAGQQSHKNSGNSQSASSSGSRSGAGVQGGTPEQHAAAGRQSHKNSGNSQSASSSGSSSRSSGGTRGGTPEQHAAAGRQSHKNSK
jgi:hypothetical protein